MAEAERYPRSAPQSAPSKGGPLAWQLLVKFITLVALLIAALLFSLIAEIIGMNFFWEDEGAQHSRDMLETEIGFLDRDFRANITGTPTAMVAANVAAGAYRWVNVESGLVHVDRYLSRPVGANDSSFVAIGKNTYQFLAPYFAAMGNTLMVFAIRLVVIGFTLPVFLIIGVIAVLDGVTELMLRRYGADREYGWLYHRIKPWATPLMLGSCFIYLGLPFSLHPNFVFLPAATFFGLAVYFTVSRFKKFL